MPITIGNGFLKSEILTNSPRNTKEAWWKVLWEKLKTSFFYWQSKSGPLSTWDVVCRTRPHTRAAYRDFFELKELACASQRDRFQVHNPHENDATIILRIMDQNEENELLRITQNTDTFSCEVMGNLYFLMKDRPDILKSHPQMTAMIKRRYSEIVDYPSLRHYVSILLARRYYRFH